MFTIIVLVCSTLTAPDARNCVIDNSVFHKPIGQVETVGQCHAIGMIEATRLTYRDGDYPKVLCARLDLLNRG